MFYDSCEAQLWPGDETVLFFVSSMLCNQSCILHVCILLDGLLYVVRCEPAKNAQLGLLYGGLGVILQWRQLASQYEILNEGIGINLD